MNILQSNFKSGVVKLRINDADDLWYLSHLIEPGDLVSGKTTRKIKIGDSEKTKVTKKTLTLKIKAETIDFDQTGTVLRINGRIKEGPEDIPKESYHALALEEGSEFTLEKAQWLNYHKQRLLEATEKKYNYLFCLFDREEAVFALSKKFGYEILSKIKGEVPKKRQGIELKKDFYQEIINTLQIYVDRYKPDYLILASPAFYKEDLLQKISSAELKKKIVLTACSDVSETSLDEVLKKPELAEILKSNRAREEQLLVNELLSEISTAGKAVYGWQETKKAIAAGAVGTLLLSDDFIRQKRTSGGYQELDEEMNTVEQMKGKIHILSSEFPSGKKLNGLGGIAALLRFKLEW